MTKPINEILAHTVNYVKLDIYQKHRNELEAKGYTVERVDTKNQNTPNEIVKYKYWK